MSHDAINNWVEKAKGQINTANESSGVQVIKRPVAMTKGNIIMELAEKLRPWLTTVLTGLRDENGMLVQPARIRAVALNVAQDIVKRQEEKHS
jgi:hypothetical protein